MTPAPAPRSGSTASGTLNHPNDAARLRHTVKPVTPGRIPTAAGSARPGPIPAFSNHEACVRAVIDAPGRGPAPF